MKAAMFQYEKVMGLIVLNREQESTTSDPAYIEMLNDDFNTLKKRKKELGSKLGLCQLNYVSYFFYNLTSTLVPLFVSDPPAQETKFRKFEYY